TRPRENDSLKIESLQLFKRRAQSSNVTLGRKKQLRGYSSLMLARYASRARVGAEPVLDHRGDALAPLAAVDDAEVPDLLGEVVLLLLRGQVRGEAERGAGLADARDVVALALDREQRGVADRVGVDRLAAVDELALGQRVLLEHVLDRLQVELG